nr:hypothetical protein [Tanacetum cinerariifolium]
PAFIALVSCDGLGGYDWSDQAEEGPNYALMAYTSSTSDSKALKVSESVGAISTNGGVDTAQSVNTANGVSTIRTQVNAAFSINIDNLSDAIIFTFLASQLNSPQLAHEDLKQSRTTSTKRSVPVETPAFIALVSCDGLGGYDWSDQAEEGPNYALMAYTSSTSDSK